MKRITAIAIAVLMILSFTCTVYADDTSVMTNKEYYAAQAYLVAKYKDGKITYSEFQQQSQAVTDEFVSKNTVGGVLQSGALNASNTFNAVAQKIGNTVQKYGESARDYINDYISDFFNSYTVLSDKPTTDLKGGTAMLKLKNDDGAYYVYYGNVPGEFYYQGSSKCLYLKTYCDEFYDRYGNLLSHYDSDSSISFDTTNRNDFNVYGKWIWRNDGTEAETDDEFETISDYDFSQASDRELEDLLKKILEAIELNEPNLSTMEGLLNAIYTRLGTLDSDDDNAMLSAINAAIISLASDTNASSAEVIGVLKELKEAMSKGADLDPVLDELKDISKSLDYLKTINTLDLIGDTVDSLLSLTDTEKTFLDTYAGLILNLSSKLGYAPVSNMISSLEAIMFNGSPPQDIAVTIYDTPVVLLSSLSFEKLQITETLNLAKLFVSVLLAVSWLYAMRKKITGGA